MGFQVSTEKETEIIDVTEKIEDLIEPDLEKGVACVSVRHTTAAIVIQENEKRLKKDLKNLLNKLAPKGDGYEHDKIDNNAHSHLRSAILGNSVTFPVKRGKLLLGTWQKILFIELDGPRTRKIDLEVVS